MPLARSPAVTTPDDRERVKAKVRHLARRKQQEIERAVRLLRAHFVDRRRRSPKRGTLHRLMLVGVFARRDGPPDRETGEINEYEIWTFVDYPEYRGRNRHWGIAHRAIASSLRARATVTLSVFTLEEMDRLRAAGNRFLTELYDGGITLWERADGDVSDD